MRTFEAGGLLLALVCVVCVGCVDRPEVVEEPVVPLVRKVEVTVPGDTSLADVEGVRRVAVSLPLERQPNKRTIGQGFSDGGWVMGMELAPPLDEVVQLTVASGFKELGFNVVLVGPMELERAAEVRTHLERYQADYICTIAINEMVISTNPIVNAPAFGKVDMELQLFGPKGGLLMPVMVTMNRSWQLGAGKPGADELRVCVEEVLKQIKRRVTSDVNLLTTLGLQLPAAAAARK